MEIFRKRLMPPELTHLESDRIIFSNSSYVITEWQTLKPRLDFATGVSYYFLEENYKLSEMYSKNGEFLYYYCDIVKYEEISLKQLIYIDLLVDVVVYADFTYKILDLDELVECHKNEGIETEDLLLAIQATHDFLRIVHSGDIGQIFQKIEGGLKYAKK